MNPYTNMKRLPHTGGLFFVPSPVEGRAAALVGKWSCTRVESLPSSVREICRHPYLNCISSPEMCISSLEI